MYELVLRDDPQERLVVADIDDTELDSIDVVFGVGMKERIGHVGHVGLNRWDLLDDVVDEGEMYDGATIVDDVLPEMLRHPGNVPVFKYLRQAGRLTKKGQIRKSTPVDPKIERMADTHRGGSPSSTWNRDHAAEHLAGIIGIADLEQQKGANEVFKFGTCIAESQVWVCQELGVTGLGGLRRSTGGSVSPTRLARRCSARCPRKCSGEGGQTAPDRRLCVVMRDGNEFSPIS